MKARQILNSAMGLGLATLLQGCANMVPTGFVCPDTVGGYKPGETNSAEVQHCMGDPVHEDHNPDGRYIYMYQLKDGTILAFLFDSSDKLIRVSGYEKTK
jgi:hypothetical protein